MPKKIVDLEIEKVAGVEMAANRRTFLIVKEGGLFDKFKAQIKKFFPEEALGVSDVLDVQEMHRELFEIDDALRVSVNSILEDDDVPNKRAAIAETLSQYLQELVDSGIVKIGRKVSGGRMAILKELMTAMGKAMESLNVMLDEVEGIEKEGSDLMPISEEVLKGLPEDVQTQIAELEKNASKAEDLLTKNTELETKITELTKEEEPKEDILKGASPEVLEKFEAMQKQVDESKEKVNEANEIAKAEKETRITKQYVDEASDLSHVGNTDTIAKMLRSADEIGEDEGKQMRETLKSAEKRITESDLLKEVGSDAAGEDSAMGRLQAMADELVQKGDITPEQAFTNVLNTPKGKELYKQHTEGVN